ncbi:MAG: formylglycine-generating enzyme family protein [Planctomycetes bacterium]|nr:formylglycine-generating enzyme family protein [Planctomycetota bacterium]
MPGLEDYAAALETERNRRAERERRRKEFEALSEKARKAEAKGGGALEEAIALWEKALESADAPNDRVAAADRVETLSAELRFVKAMAAAREAEKRGDAEAAKKAYAAALGEKPGDAEAKDALKRLEEGPAKPPDPPPDTPAARRERYNSAVKEAAALERKGDDRSRIEALKLWREALALAEGAQDRRLLERSLMSLATSIIQKGMADGRKAEAKRDWITAAAAYGRAAFANPDESLAQKALARAKAPLDALAKALGPRFLVPPGDEEKDRRGNPVVAREGLRMDPVSGWPYEIWTDRPRTELVLVPAGEFEIGAPPSEADRYVEEGPPTRVRFARPFYVGKYEITQDCWEAMTGENRSAFPGADLPVQNVSWNDAKAFLKKWNAAGGAPPLRLPSEAEWEYAARAGSKTRFCLGNEDSALDEAGWFKGNSEEKPRPVGRKKPNAWGLYDAHGNVWEFCEDVRHDSYEGLPADGSPWTEGGKQDLRTARGGACNSEPRDCRSARRNCDVADRRVSSVGFRIAFTPVK